MGGFEKNYLQNEGKGKLLGTTSLNTLCASDHN